MSSAIFNRGPTTPKMNITPLIDVVFLLIIFFMLVNNIIGEENAPMIVPDLRKPETHALGREDRVVVQVIPSPYNPEERQGTPLEWNGRPRSVRVGQQTFSLHDVAAVTHSLREARKKNPRIKVLLRADSALYYRAVQPVMAAISAANIKNVDLVAILPRNQTGSTPQSATPPAGSK